HVPILAPRQPGFRDAVVGSGRLVAGTPPALPGAALAPAARGNRARQVPRAPGSDPASLPDEVGRYVVVGFARFALQDPCIGVDRGRGGRGLARDEQEATLLPDHREIAAVERLQ